MKKNCTQHLDAGNKICDQVPNCGCCGVSHRLWHAKCWKWRPGLHAWPRGTQPGDVTLLMAVASGHSPAPGTQEALWGLSPCAILTSSLFSLETPHDKKVIPEELSAIPLPPLPSKRTGVLLQEQPVVCVHTCAFRHTENSLLRVLGTQA